MTIQYPFFIPDLDHLEAFQSELDEVWQSRMLTNNGPALQRLETELASICGVKHVVAMSNGTVALQSLLSALPQRGEVITTAFSFAATLSAILGAGHSPKFCDVDLLSANLTPEEVEPLITKDTVAILPVHCYGNLCDLNGFDALSSKTGVPVLYDAAHAIWSQSPYGAVLGGGLASAVSFHATKVFSCVEGGAVFTNDVELAQKMQEMRSFGLFGDKQLGSNYKLSELHAAYGLAMLPQREKARSHRLNLYRTYRAQLPTKIRIHLSAVSSQHNLAYLPISVPDMNAEQVAIEAKNLGLEVRRYFHPSLNTLDLEIPKSPMTNSELLSSTIVCLPLHSNLRDTDVRQIAGIIREIYYNSLEEKL